MNPLDFVNLCVFLAKGGKSRKRGVGSLAGTTPGKDVGHLDEFSATQFNFQCTRGYPTSRLVEAASGLILAEHHGDDVNAALPTPVVKGRRQELAANAPPLEFPQQIERVNFATGPLPVINTDGP